MKKLFLILILVIFVFGCSAKPEPAPIEQTVAAPEKTCPATCDDSNACTKDSCSSATEFECKNEKITPCCGDGACESDETCTSCEKDCGTCYSLENLKTDINTVYKKEVVYQENSLNKARKDYENTADSSMNYYSSTYITIFEIKDKQKYISTPDEFKTLIKDLSNKKVELMAKLLPATYPKETYSFSAKPEVSVLEDSSSALMMKSIVWAEIKKGSKFTDPEKSMSVYVYCRPDLFVEVFSRQPSTVETFWQNLDQTGYNEQYTRFTGREIGNILTDAAKISELCFQKKQAKSLDAAEGISFDLKSITIDKDYINGYDYTDGFYLNGFERQLNVKGELVNNLNEDADDIKILLRLFNEKVFETSNAVRTNLYVGQKNITLKEAGSTSATMTPTYTDLIKPISYLSISGKSFPPNSRASVDTTFSYNVPDWDGQLYHYNEDFKAWTAGNYDVDKGQLVIVKGDEVVYVKDIELPPAYMRDTRIFIDRLDSSYGDGKGDIHAVSFTINNSGAKDVSMPAVKVFLKELTKEGNFAIGEGRVIEKSHSSAELKITASVMSLTAKGFRFSLDSINEFELGSQTDQRGYMLYFYLYEGDQLLDKKAHMFWADSKLYITTIYNDELVTYVDPMSTSYSLSVDKILDTDKSPDGKKGVYLTIKRMSTNRADLDIKHPTLDLFCGGTEVYALNENIISGFEKQVWVPFEWGNCVSLVVNLRDGDNAKVYAANVGAP